MKSPASASSPLSRRFDVSSLRDGAVSFRVEASAAEREALAADCDLPAIAALVGDLRVAREGTDGVRVTGRVTARPTQICVVTLEPFESDLAEEVDVGFAPESEVAALAEARAARPGSVEDDPEAEDLPDPIVNGRIDLGALTAEIFVLGLDPYPRKSGAVFDEPAPARAEDAVSPFAVLKGLKGGDAD